MEHLTSEQIKKLSVAYLNDRTLNDEELSFKKHMANCDNCYENFCAEYLILKNLFDIGLVNEDIVLGNYNNICDGVIMRISLIKDRGKKLLLELNERFSENPLWQFDIENSISFARGEEDEECYNSLELEDSSIRVEGDILYIELDDIFFEDREISVVLSDENHYETRDFEYDDDIEMHVLKIDLSEWSENVEIGLVEK